MTCRRLTYERSRDESAIKKTAVQRRIVMIVWPNILKWINWLRSTWYSFRNTDWFLEPFSLFLGLAFSLSQRSVIGQKSTATPLWMSNLIYQTPTSHSLWNMIGIGDREYVAQSLNPYIPPCDTIMLTLIGVPSKMLEYGIPPSHVPITMGIGDREYVPRSLNPNIPPCSVCTFVHVTQIQASWVSSQMFYSVFLISHCTKG